MRYGCAIVGTLTFFLFALPVAGTERHMLNNGLTILYRQDRKSRLTSVTAFIRGGTYAETDEKAGITNLLQRMLLKGTAQRTADEIADEIEALGGMISQDTANDYALISLLVPTRYFRQGFRIFSDMLKNPSFPDDEIKKEKAVILGEIRARHDEIFPYAYHSFLEAFYDTFPYSRTVLGKKETVRAIQRKDLIEWHRVFYAPNNIILVVHTGMPFREIIKEVDAELGYLLPLDRVGVRAEEFSGHSETLLVTKKGKFAQAYIILGYAAPSISSKDYLALKLLNTIIGEGGSSRLFIQIREKMGLAYEVGSFYPSRKHSSHFAVYAGLSAEDIGRAKESLHNVLEMEASDTEIADAKSFLIGKFILDHESPQRQTWYLGWYEVLGMGYQYDEKYPYEIAGINREDIERVSRTYLKKGNWVCVEVLPGDRKNK